MTNKRKTIYLDDAIEAIRKLPNAGIHWYVSAEAVFDVLLKLPSAQQDFDIDQKINKAYDDGYDQGYLQCEVDKEPIIGHWIERRKKGSCYWQSWCSVCGKHSGIGGIVSNRHKPFCPNCGSPMEGVVYDV